MKTSRRSLFGWLAGAVVAAPAVAKASAPATVEKAPEFFVGQIRAHSHFVTEPVGYTLGCSRVSVVYRYEQWDGTKWVHIPTVAAAYDPGHTHMGHTHSLSPSAHTHSLSPSAHAHGITR